MAIDSAPILLVEDSEPDAMLIEHAFRKARVQNPFVRCLTAREAKTFLSGAAKPPVFVLLDLNLPDDSGHEVLRWVRKESREPDLPVVVVTGLEHESEREKANALGATAFFSKTLNFEDLVHLVRSVGAHWILHTGN